MERMIEHIEKLKDAVVAVFGQTLDAPTAYEQLSADIQKITGELISVSTLKRLFGYIKPGTIPRPSTLSVLARYVGSAGWSDFCSRCSMENRLFRFLLFNLCSRSPLAFGKDGAATPKPYLSAEELPDFDGSRPRTQL